MQLEMVFDSSTAILLAKITLLKSVAERFQIIFPEKVQEETTKKQDNFDSKLIQAFIEQKKIIIVKIKNQEVEMLIRDFPLEKGEAEAIVLARERNSPLATDDGPSIKVCKILGIKFTTSIHYLVHMYEGGIINKKATLEKLKMLERYGRYKTDIIRDAKIRIEGGN